MPRHDIDPLAHRRLRASSGASRVLRTKRRIESKPVASPSQAISRTGPKSAPQPQEPRPGCSAWWSF